MRCTVFFCASTVKFSRNVGARESEVWWIATLGDGAFGMCMPVYRKGERGKRIFFAPAVKFSWTGGRFFLADL